VAGELWKENSTAESGFGGMGDRFDPIISLELRFFYLVFVAAYQEHFCLNKEIVSFSVVISLSCQACQMAGPK
jgi:hypothetical protein